MSYANGTTHYNLPQTVGTDKRDWFDTNEAFASVDADLNTAYTTANAAASNISALDTRVTAAEGDIVDLKAEDVSLGSRVSALGDSVTALSATVRDNKQDLSDAICSVVEGSATAEYAHAIGEYFWYNDTLYITTVAINIGDTIVPNTNCDTVTVTTELKALYDSIVGEKTWTQGAVQNVTLGSNFTAPHDGYLACAVNDQADNAYAYVSLYDGATRYDIGSFTYTTGTGLTTASEGLFLRKGITVRVTGSNAKAEFFPIS